MKLKSSMKCDEPNANGHIYPREVFEDALNEYKKKIDEKKSFGCLYPSGDSRFDIILLEHVSHIVDKIELQDDGSYECDVTILDTPKGDLLKQLIENDSGMATNLVVVGSLDGSTVTKIDKVIRIDIIPKF